jgi:excisionase family DNA binding protein
MIMDNILTVNDVAAILKVKPITVREMFRDERIRGFKVGKAWRTTEKMLQEDIEKLAKGEAPDKLPKSNGHARQKNSPKKSAAKAASVAKKTKESVNEDQSNPVPQKKPEQKPESDTTQQLLF